MSKTIFTDGNPSLGELGTLITAAFLNAMQNHRHDGGNIDGSCPLNYAVDSGVANAYVIGLSPPLTGHVPGMPIIWKALAANTGASTINIDGLGGKLLVRRDGSALQPGDIPAGSICIVVYDGVNYQAAFLESGSAFEASLVSNGYQRFPSGWIVQWGKCAAPDDQYGSISFPLAFPNACFCVLSQMEVTGALTGSQAGAAVIGNVTQSTFKIGAGITASATQTGYAFWVAIGY